MYTEFVESAKKGEILSYKCRKCGMFSIKGDVCPFCGARDLEKGTAPREGKVITYTKIFVAPPEFSSEAPYAVALVELDNGMRIMCRVNSDVDMGKEVVFSGVKECNLGLSLVFEAKA
jgi:hypothetical protein